MKKLLLLLCVLAGAGWGMSNDTTTILYGVSNEPMTATDTVTVRHYHKDNNGFYLMPISGGEIWAAWIKPITRGK